VLAILSIRVAAARRRERLPFFKDTRDLEAEEEDFYTGRRYRGRYRQVDILGHIRTRLTALLEPEDDERRRYVIETRLQNVAMLLDYVARRFGTGPEAVDGEAVTEIDASHPLVTDLERKPTQYGAGDEVAMIRNSLKAKLHAWIAERKG